MVEAGKATDNNIIRRTRFSCYVTSGYTHTLGIRNTYYSSPATLVAGTRLNITFMHTLYGLSPLVTSIPDDRNERYKNYHFLSSG